MPHSYESVKRFNLFKESNPPGSKKPDFGNSKVVFEAPLEPGRYSFSGWQYTDTGNISVEIQRMTEVEDGGGGGGGGFDD